MDFNNSVKEGLKKKTPLSGLKGKKRSEKKKTRKNWSHVGARLEFSPMFEKPTKVKLACIVLAFTAVVHKRLMKLNQKSHKHQKQTMLKEQRKSLQSLHSIECRIEVYTRTFRFVAEYQSTGVGRTDLCTNYQGWS